jgi:HEPN domain-containing protein
MTALPEGVRQHVREWARRADEDLHLAQHALGMGAACPYALVAFHAQQCGEKYLKAYLVLRGVDFPFTHNISLLLELCTPHAAWATVLDEAELLTRYAIVARYPGTGVEVSEEKARAAVDIAARVREVVRPALRDEGVALD